MSVNRHKAKTLLIIPARGNRSIALVVTPRKTIEIRIVNSSKGFNLRELHVPRILSSVVVVKVFFKSNKMERSKLKCSHFALVTMWRCFNVQDFRQFGQKNKELRRLRENPLPLVASRTISQRERVTNETSCENSLSRSWPASVRLIYIYSRNLQPNPFKPNWQTRRRITLEKKWRNKRLGNILQPFFFQNEFFFSTTKTEDASSRHWVILTQKCLLPQKSKFSMKFLIFKISIKHEY